MAHNSMLTLCLCRDSRPRQEVCQNAESCLNEILTSYIMHTLAGSLPDSGVGGHWLWLTGTASPAGSGRSCWPRWGPFSAPGYHSASRAKRPGHQAAAVAGPVATALAARPVGSGCWRDPRWGVSALPAAAAARPVATTSNNRPKHRTTPTIATIARGMQRPVGARPVPQFGTLNRLVPRLGLCTVSSPVWDTEPSDSSHRDKDNHNRGTRQERQPFITD